MVIEPHINNKSTQTVEDNVLIILIHAPFVFRFPHSDIVFVCPHLPSDAGQKHWHGSTTANIIWLPLSQRSTRASVPYGTTGAALAARVQRLRLTPGICWTIVGVYVVGTRFQPLLKHWS